MSAVVWYRSSAFFARHLPASHSSSIGTPVRKPVIGSGSSLVIEYITALS